MIVIERASLALVVDDGRRGRMHEGVAWSGPLAPELMARANAAAGNARLAAAIELHGAITLRATAPARLATERGDVHALEAGDALTIGRDASLRVRYLAITGGFDVPRVLGSRTTLLAARLGGAGGAALRSGTSLSAGTDLGDDRPPPWEMRADEPLAIVAGPDHEAFHISAITELTSQEYTITPASDRTGTRLSGPPLVRRGPDTQASAPMVAGAIQVAADGAPIVLGPDHPTTGGYPVVAAIASRDLGRFFARPVGSPVRFCELRS